MARQGGKKGTSGKGRSGAVQSALPARRVGKTVLSPDLMSAFETAPPPQRTRANAAPVPPSVFDVILEMNVDMPGGAEAARNLLLPLLNKEAPASSLGVFGLNGDRLKQVRIGRVSVDGFAVQPPLSFAANEIVALAKSLLTDRYVFATLTQEHIQTLVHLCAVFATDADAKPHRLLYKAWLDREVEPFVFSSSRTIKADAASAAFSANGKGIVWAVADTGIDATHPHFKLHDTLNLPEGLRHLDFTVDEIAFAQDMPGALLDAPGHGTHVAGIIAGETRAGSPADDPASVERTLLRRAVRHGEGEFENIAEDGPPRICGVAPLCKLMSLRVLDDARKGKASTLIAAIGYIMKANDYGHRIRIHGLNLSVGYEIEPEWFAAGRSPLCNEVDRLVRSGVVVVVAAGNAGFGRVNTASGRQEQASFSGTIADPGNSALAITVGSTHRDMPHAYGVSYFSSKGPTADGRAKPDLLAPGERILSCSAHDPAPPGVAAFREDCGTSMAAPHVSGAIAAFLSIRSEFIGRPDEVKALFLTTATDLKRLSHYQGQGLIDLMRAIQAV